MVFDFLLTGVLTVHVPKKGNAYLAGTVHVAKEVQTIQRFLLEPYMWEKRAETNTGTVHVAKCSSEKTQTNTIKVKARSILMIYLLKFDRRFWI